MIDKVSSTLAPSNSKTNLYAKPLAKKKKKKAPAPKPKPVALLKPAYLSFSQRTVEFAPKTKPKVKNSSKLN